METNVMLWQFLLEILKSEKFYNIIRWTNSRGEFKLIDAEEVARMWGLRKNKTNMNYDKLSRALRYYYQKNIIQKVLGQKFVYRFVSIPWVEKDYDEDSPEYYFNLKVDPTHRSDVPKSCSHYLNQLMNLPSYVTSESDESSLHSGSQCLDFQENALKGFHSLSELESFQKCRFCGAARLGSTEKLPESLKCWKDLCSSCNSHFSAALYKLLLPQPMKQVLLERYWNHDSYDIVMPP